MKSPSLTVKAHPLAGMGLAAGLLRRTVLHQLYKLRHGQLTLHHGDQQQLFGDLASPLKAEIHVLDAGLWGLVAARGSIGAGEAYIHGYWTSPDLTAVIRLFVANLDVLDS
ncbi:MAG: SAM-dependent methyltransferase, partial [Stutzerimonas stutzeri]